MNDESHQHWLTWFHTHSRCDSPYSGISDVQVAWPSGVYNYPVILQRIECRLLELMANGPDSIGQFLKAAFTLPDFISHGDSDLCEAFHQALNRMVVRLAHAHEAVAAGFDRASGDHWNHGLGPNIQGIPLAKLLANRHTPLSRNAVVFPTYDPKEPNVPGHLVRAEILVFQHTNGEVAFELAPWTFFVLAEKLEAITNLDDAQGRRLVLDLQPIAKDDITCFSRRKADERQAAVWSLMPRHFMIEGKSLGLALAIAAHAAVKKLSVPPVIATGEVKSSGEIERIDGVNEKVAAINRFLNYNTREWHVICPKANFNGSLSLKRGCIHWSDHLTNELFSARNAHLCLTDGFDELREKDDAFPRIVWQNDETQFGYPPDFEKKAETIAKSTAERWSGITVPFDEDPRELALHLGRVMRGIYWNHKSGEMHEKPVMLPVHLRALVAAGLGAKLANLPRLLADHVRMQFKLREPDEYAISNALRREDKLILLVYDERATTLGARLADDKGLATYRSYLAAIRKLAHDPADFGYQPQRIVAICSDYCHEQLWRE